MGSRAVIDTFPDNFATCLRVNGKVVALTARISGGVHDGLVILMPIQVNRRHSTVLLRHNLN